jgi:hypothetical protein
MSDAMTAAPFFANCLAIAQPHPLPPAPVTIAMQLGIIAGKYMRLSFRKYVAVAA